MKTNGSSRIAILKILEKYSDCNHHLSINQIIEYLEKDYNISPDRKTVSKAIKEIILIDSEFLGYDVIKESGKGGVYIENRPFTESELKLLIDSVISSKYINISQTKDLVNKLGELTSSYFKNNMNEIKFVNDWEKTESCEFFLNIELLNEAIQNNKAVNFNYVRRRANGTKNKGQNHTVSPYFLVYKEQKYYLLARDHNLAEISTYRIDKITDIEILNDMIRLPYDSATNSTTISFKKISNNLPHMFQDEVIDVEFKIHWKMVDILYDFIPYKNIQYERVDDNYYVGKTKISKKSIQILAFQFINDVEILSPTSLINEIKDIINKAKNKYENN